MPIAKDLSKFYAFRDKLPSFIVRGYYKVSPYLVWITNKTNSRHRVRRFFDKIEKYL
jgi:hypothetical protein